MADDADNTADDTDSDDQAEETSDDQAQEEYKPPSKEEWEKVRGAAKKAREERDRVRSELAASRRDKQSDEEKAAEREANEQKWKSKAVTNAAVSALQNAGYGKAQARELAKIVDLSQVELDDDGEIDLEDDIARLAKTFPPEKLGRGPRTTVTTGRGREDSAPKDDVDARFAKKLLGLR